MMQDAAVHALVCLIHADFGVLLTLFLYSREKFSPFGDKEAGLCAGWCRVASNPVIVVGNLMTLARADSEGEALQVTPTDLNEVFLEISEPARLLAQGKSIDYEQRLAEMPLRVSGNAPSLRKLFLILIDNAVKYTPREGRISVALDASDGAAVTEIRDNGMGISPADLPHIFERFYRADESRSRSRAEPGLVCPLRSGSRKLITAAFQSSAKLVKGRSFEFRFP